ncbi:hypothetical protein Pint_10798 [Pistacia integerrima]|uniref:Uncharacterized protein n=1 Tax=Pistacia integerrima TaxID=434235 RepID=A0ACC0XG23_9ROSI|nr:hypothetical protein Pint_10798 [Pistacia integerrima]
MELICGGRISVVLAALLYCLSDFGATRDTIKSSQFIRDLKTIISSDNIFTLGFLALEEVLRSSNISHSVTNLSAQLLGSGNLVLLDHNNGIRVWESFQEQPTDKFLSSMKRNTNLRTCEKVKLTLWKSPSDPSIGGVSAGIDPFEIPEIYIWNHDQPY